MNGIDKKRKKFLLGLMRMKLALMKVMKNTEKKG
jgi:hypothetical protein